MFTAHRFSLAGLLSLVLAHSAFAAECSPDQSRGAQVFANECSVCHAVATLKKGGFLLMDGDHFLHLTDLGREVAEATYEKHRFFTDRLIEAGVDPETAERDACRIEHVISEETFERLKVAHKQSEKAVISSDES